MSSCYAVTFSTAAQTLSPDAVATMVVIGAFAAGILVAPRRVRRKPAASEEVAGS